MKNFRTTLPPLTFPFNMQHQQQILSMGSCFAAHIGTRLERLKFPICRNPFGILYNPMSILNGLQVLVDNYQFGADDLFQHNELWHSFQHHSQFSGVDRVTVLAHIQKQTELASEALSQSKHLILTFGTAYIYEHLQDKKVVANCHKLPAAHFQKRRLKIEEIVKAYAPVLAYLKAQNSDLEVLFTVSPVRHIRDGVIENQRSKAILLLAIDALCEAFDFVHYFPAYEILMDDLRDYRFYASDMLHPSEVAIDYVWDNFQDSLFSEQTKQLNQRIRKLQQAAAHRPFHAASAGHQRFLQKQLTQIQQLLGQYSFLDLEEEKAVFESQLI